MQKQLSRPKGKHVTGKQGSSLECLCSSIDELPCLPEFELLLQKEPGKGECHAGKAANIGQAISACEHSSAVDVSVASSSRSSLCSCL